MQTGTIAVLKDKGFGFIKVEDGEKDVFFHANELQNVQFNDLQEGDKVEFEVTDGQKGPQATQVSKV
jgi:CspA family cold shock protein